MLSSRSYYVTCKQCVSSKRAYRTITHCVIHMCWCTHLMIFWRGPRFEGLRPEQHHSIVLNGVREVSNVNCRGLSVRLFGRGEMTGISPLRCNRIQQMCVAEWRPSIQFKSYNCHSDAYCASGSGIIAPRAYREIAIEIDMRRVKAP